MNLVVHVLRRMGGRATTLLPFSLLLGIAFQETAAAFRPLVEPGAIVLLTLALARTDWARVLDLLRRPVPALVLSVAQLVLVPLAVWQVYRSLGLWPGLVAALSLSAMGPGIISATTTAGFLRLDASLALLMTLFTNLFVPFTLPPLALKLLGLDLKISAIDLSLRLAFIVAVSFAGAMGIRLWLGAERLRRSSQTLDGLSVIVLMAFTIPLMDGIVARAAADPLKLLGFIGGSFGGMLACNAVLALSALPFLDRRMALTAGYCSQGRHNALLMAVLPAAADPDIFLFISAVQIPLYVLPALLQPIYRRLLGVAPGD